MQHVHIPTAGTVPSHLVTLRLRFAMPTVSHKSLPSPSRTVGFASIAGASALIGSHHNASYVVEVDGIRGDAMKVLLTMACVFLASGLFARDCAKNARGRTVCGNGQTATAVNPNTGNAAVAHKNQNGVTTTQTSNGGEAKTKNGVGVAQGPNGTTTAANAKTGNAAVAQKNQNGVTTTQTSNGGRAKTKNGMGVSQGPNGTTCAKGENHQGCKK
jgi:hypothetical protein